MENNIKGTVVIVNMGLPTFIILEISLFLIAILQQSKDNDSVSITKQNFIEQFDR